MSFPLLTVRAFNKTARTRGTAAAHCALFGSASGINFYVLTLDADNKLV